MYKTRRLIRDSILFTRTVSSKRGLTWEFWDSILGVHRGVVVATDALYVLFQLRSFFFWRWLRHTKTHALLASGYNSGVPQLQLANG